MRPTSRRTLAVVLVIALHVLLAVAVLYWRPSWPTLSMGGHGGSAALFALPRPAPRPVKIPAPVAAAKPVGPGRLFEDCADTPGRAMVADVYRLSRTTETVGAMRRLKPVRQVCLAQLSMAPHAFREGFPGMADLVDWFGLDIRFNVKIAEAGAFDFVLLAGDGAVLSIDDEDVISNDGLHEPRVKTGRAKLDAGLRRFRVRYFHGPGASMALLLGWKKANEKAFGTIPSSLMARPSAR